MMKGRTAVATHRHLVYVQSAGTAVADGDGGFSTPWAYLTPSTWWCAIEPLTARDLERLAPGTIMSTASHIITGPYHPQISVASRLVFRGRIFNVTGVANPEERNIRTICIAVELLGQALLVDQQLTDPGLFQSGLAQEGFA